MNGLEGLLEATPKNLETGLWKLFQRSNIGTDFERIESRGSQRAAQVFGLDDFLGPRGRRKSDGSGSNGEYSRDSQIGSIGGGNHFVEIQQVVEIQHPSLAYQSGVKVGQLAIAIHSGSRNVGKYIGGMWRDRAKAAWLKGNPFPQSSLFAQIGRASCRERV